MEDEFSRALDSLHSKLDDAVASLRKESSVPRADPVLQSWAFQPEAPPREAPKSDSTTVFLVRAFLCILLLGGLYYVWVRVNQRPKADIQLGPEPTKDLTESHTTVHEEPELPKLLQTDALEQAELEYLLKVKTMPIEPAPVAMAVAPVAPQGPTQMLPPPRAPDEPVRPVPMPSTTTSKYPKFAIHAHEIPPLVPFSSK